MIILCKNALRPTGAKNTPLFSGKGWGLGEGKTSQLERVKSAPTEVSVLIFAVAAAFVAVEVAAAVAAQAFTIA